MMNVLGASLTYFVYALARNPDAERKLLEEIDRLNDNGPINHDQLDDYKYLDWCINESMRTCM